MMEVTVSNVWPSSSLAWGFFLRGETLLLENCPGTSLGFVLFSYMSNLELSVASVLLSEQITISSYWRPDGIENNSGIPDI